jgi:hypothetical protein
VGIPQHEDVLLPQTTRKRRPEKRGSLANAQEATL